jgi:hypothetical protein
MYSAWVAWDQAVLGYLLSTLIRDRLAHARRPLLIAIVCTIREHMNCAHYYQEESTLCYRLLRQDDPLR